MRNARDDGGHGFYTGFAPLRAAVRWVRARLYPPTTVAGWAATISGTLAALIVSFALFVMIGLPSPDSLWTAKDLPSVTYLDRNGIVIARQNAQNAPPVDLARLPKHVSGAVIAIEDRRFRQHLGVDVEGLSRAMIRNVRAGKVVQGGSTITQQLAKNLFLSNKRTFRRKAQEIIMALWLESKFTKDEILALYLSRVYFGAGAWGVEAAAERYFDKPASKLSLPEAALLAGLLKAPSDLNLASGKREGAWVRAETVMSIMASEKFITPKEREEAVAQKALVLSRISNKSPNGNLGWFLDWVDDQVDQVASEHRGDLIVETTLDIAAQRKAEQTVFELIGKADSEGRKRNVTQAAALTIDAEGGVRVMVGGTAYGDTEFNRTVQSKRQPGSSFKTFVYLAAMEKGLTPNTVRWDTPITIQGWSPRNYKEEYYGQVTLGRAFAASMNTVAVQLGEEVGRRKVIEAARRLGVQSPLLAVPSLTLGAQEMSLLEMTRAYAIFSNDGKAVTTHGITRIRMADEKNGRVVWEQPKTTPTVLIEERPLRFMNDLLSRVTAAGTGTRAKVPGRVTAGKTGTANDYRDAWFIGYVKGLAMGVWVGNDNTAQMDKVTGGQYPAQIWSEVMTLAARDLPAGDIPMPQAADLGAGDVNAAAPSTIIDGTEGVIDANAIVPSTSGYESSTSGGYVTPGASAPAPVEYSQPAIAPPPQAPSRPSQDQEILVGGIVVRED